MLHKEGMIDFQVSFEDYLKEIDLDPRSLDWKVDYVEKDLLDLDEIRYSKLDRFERTYFEGLFSEHEGGRKVAYASKFQVPGRKIEKVLIRLRDRLSYEPLRTIIGIQMPGVKLEIRTENEKDLSGIIQAFEQDFLFTPICRYLVEAEKYVRTEGGIPEGSSNNLSSLREKLELSSTVDFSESLSQQLLDKVTGSFSSKDKRQQHFEKAVEQEVEYLEQLIKNDWFRVNIEDDKAIAERFRESWLAVKEFAENLFLPMSEAEEYYKQAVEAAKKRIGTYKNRKYLIEKYTLKISSQRRDREEKLEKELRQEVLIYEYQELFRKFIQENIYPSELNQAKLLMIRSFLEIPNKQVLEMEERIRGEEYGGIISEFGADYSRLRYLLYKNDWKAADAETEYSSFQSSEVHLILLELL